MPTHIQNKIHVPHTHTDTQPITVNNNKHKYQLAILTQNKLDTSNKSWQVCEIRPSSKAFIQVFSRLPFAWLKCSVGIFKSRFTGNWNRKTEPGNDSLGQVSGYPDTWHSLILMHDNLMPLLYMKTSNKTKILGIDTAWTIL